MTALTLSRSFVGRMALRELRASWRRLLFFFICIAIGVAAIVALRSVIQNIRAGIGHEARGMLGADVVLSSNNAFSSALRQRIGQEQRAGRIMEVVEATELVTMARAGANLSATRMVELRAIPEGFPIYGAVTLQSGTYSHALVEHGGALARPELLAQLGLKVGDHIRIGQAMFTVRGVVATEPGRTLGTFSLGPRVFIDAADLAATGLLSYGSRASHQLLLRVPDEAVDPLAADLRESFVNDFVGVRTYRRADDQIGQNLTRAENYLSLVGLVVLILGGIGVSSVTRVFVQQKIRSVAILKCIGSTTRQILAVYVTQVIVLGCAGCVLGVALAAAVVTAIPHVVGPVANTLGVRYGLTVSAVAQGGAVGLLVSLLFAIVPLLDVRHVKPSLLLREEATDGVRFDWTRWLVLCAVVIVLIVVAAWQAGSLRVALMLAGGLVALAAVLHGVGVGLVRAVQPLRYARSFAVRHAVIHMARPGNQTNVILLAVGLGAFFILGVRSLQANLLRDFALEMGADAPDMFLMDLQADQRDPLSDLIDAQNGDNGRPVIIPVLRARVTGIRGREIQLENYQDVRGRGSLAREYTVTYRAALEANESILEGAWWGPSSNWQPEVSVEESLRDRFQIAPGDEMRFDILGRTITARVANIRRVEWRDFRSGGFMFVFRPGTFDNAPHTYLSTAKGPTDPAARGRLVAAIVNQFPNITVIDLREVLDRIQTIAANVTLGVTVVGGLVLVSGILILIGAVSMTKFRRIYEAAILKTLGATTRLVGMMLLVEYGVLGAIAGVVGALGSIALSWSVATYALEMPWTASPVLALVGIAATSLLVAAVGVLASVDVLRRKPLVTLRAE
jgi:putative ABC transport system permease protein